MTYTSADEGCHEPDDNPLWQESVVVAFYDGDTGVGGQIRIGHTPNQGTTNFWHGLFKRGGEQYRQGDDAVALKAEDRGSHTLGSGGMVYRAGDGENRVVYDDGLTAIDLRFEDFYPLSDLWPHGQRAGKDVDVEQKIIRQHFECSGRIYGEVRMRDEVTHIDGLFHRDHSWGPRNWEQLPGHRWFNGTRGPDLSFSAGILLGEEDVFSGGYAVRDGALHQADNVDVIVGLEADNLTVRNAEATWFFPDAEPLTLEWEHRGGIMNGNGRWIESDQLGVFRIKGEKDFGGMSLVSVSTGFPIACQPRLALRSALAMGFTPQRAEGRVKLFETLAG